MSSITSLSTSFPHFPLRSCPFQSFSGRVNGRKQLKDKREEHTNTHADILLYYYIRFVLIDLENLQ